VLTTRPRLSTLTGYVNQGGHILKQGNRVNGLPLSGPQNRHRQIGGNTAIVHHKDTMTRSHPKLAARFSVSQDFSSFFVSRCLCVEIWRCSMQIMTDPARLGSVEGHDLDHSLLFTRLPCILKLSSFNTEESLIRLNHFRVYTCTRCHLLDRFQTVPRGGRCSDRPDYTRPLSAMPLVYPPPWRAMSDL
jgi:hypothetical protein